MSRWWRRGSSALPQRELRQRVVLQRGDRVLAAGQDVGGSGWLVATAQTIAALDDSGALRWQRAWYEVDHGSWDQDTGAVTVTWVGREPPARWHLGPEHRDLLQVLRERVQASVVATEDAVLDGRRVGRVVVRQDLATSDLLVQVLPMRGSSRDDPRVGAAMHAAEDTVREMAGLPPAR